ncbi:hypothetical protein ACHAXR_005470 [Thalassiosira sp. AJA248-18]
MKSKRHMNIRGIGVVALLLICLSSILFTILPTASALEATFTPNPADSIENGGDGGPLPVSMAQRKQLLELEAAIINSQDPSATLNHVAQQNGMSQEELAGMLERNRNDLLESGQYEGLAGEINAAMQAQGGPGGGGGGRSMATSLPRRIISLVVSIFMALIKTASVQISRNPKQSTIFAMVLACTLLSIHNAPRNGIVISSGTFPPFSRGHTTLLEPPIDYLERHAVKSWEKGGWISSLPEPMEIKSSKKTSSKSKKSPPLAVGGVGMTRSLDLDTTGAEDGEVTVETSRSKEEGFTLLTSAQTLISIDEIIVQDQKKDEDIIEEAMECMHESITSIFEERKFSEFVPDSSQSLKFRSFLVASEDEEDEDATMEGAFIAMKLLGDFGRYGVQPMCISYETDDDDEEGMIHCVAFHTLTGGHFDGELRFMVQDGDSGSIAISVTFAIPKGGRAPPIRLAEAMVSSFAQSIAQSSQLRMKQTLARRSQSSAYRARASGRAASKRHLRYEQEKAQEEMAVERKRKWKRNNPDAGSYRPSGHRLRSPNNLPSRRH